VRITLASCGATLLALATYLPALGATVAESVYDRGLRLLAELLAREAFIPEPTVASLQKYFPPLCGVLPPGLSKEEWGDRLEYYRDLVTQFGRSGVPPRPLLNAVKMWEWHECRRAKKMPVPRAAWYQEAIAEWERIRDASREGRPTRPPKPPAAARSTPAVRSTPTSSPTPPRDQAADAIEERRRRVEEHLRAHPEQQCTFDIVNAPMRPEPGEPVSVVRAVRQGDNIVSDEVLIPREQFDFALFLHSVDPAGKSNDPGAGDTGAVGRADLC
jgi:hypothetical protein